MTEPRHHYTIKTERQSRHTSDTNRLAITSLVFGILAWIILPLIGGMIAIITGHIARSQIKRREQDGAGIALAGLILGYINMVIFLVGVVAAIMLPAYHNYVLRQNMETATAAIASQRYELEKQILAEPDKQNEINQEMKLDAVATGYWQNAGIQNGNMVLQFSTNQSVTNAFQTQLLVLTPELADDKIIWHCELTGKFRSSVLPKFCIERNSK